MVDQNKKQCPNCGTEVIGDYCHNCGQDQREYRVSVRHLLNDFTSNYLTVDSKLIQSVFPLFFKPGYLTRAYLSGKRVSYIRPLRLYLFASFIFFFVLSIGNKHVSVVGATDNNAIADSTMQALNQELSGVLDSTQLASIKSQIAGDTVKDRDSFDSIKVDSSKLLQTFKIVPSSDGSSLEVYIVSRGRKYHRFVSAASFRKNFMSNLPTMMFFLLPVFALYMKLFYIRRKRLYVEHLVYSLYTHSFMFVVFAAIIIIPWSLPSTILAWSILVYLYIAQKKVYSQGYLKTGVKYVGLVLFYSVTLGIALLLTMIATILLSM